MSWLLLIMGRLYYRERLSTPAWVGCFIGALAVAALAFSRVASRMSLGHEQ